MPKVTIEIDDVLPECVEEAIDGVRDLLFDYLADNDGESTPDLSNDLDYSGDVSDIIDSAVIIDDEDIKAAWFLHGKDLQLAYETAGIGDNPMEKNGRVAIYFYIYEKVVEWYHDKADGIREEWLSDRSCTDE